MTAEKTRPARIGWVVDCQVDFLEPEGRLYVRNLFEPDDAGARQVLPALKRAVHWMEAHCPVVVFTGDWHALDDEEIDAEAPDAARGTYPPHCMGRSPDAAQRAGAEIVAALRPRDPLVLEIGADEADARRVARAALQQGRPVFVHKNRFDVFEGNPATDVFLRALETELAAPLEFVVAGVARDVCVTGAVDGMQARGYRVTALRDATWGLGLEAEEVTLERWRQRGRVITTSELPKLAGAGG